MTPLQIGMIVLVLAGLSIAAVGLAWLECRLREGRDNDDRLARYLNSRIDKAEERLNTRLGTLENRVQVQQNALTWDERVKLQQTNICVPEAAEVHVQIKRNA